jgi:hypothetical protein
MGHTSLDLEYSRLSEKELQCLYKAADRAALDELWARHRDGLCLEAHGRCSGGDVLTDVALERTCDKLRIAEVRERYDPKSPWRPWVFSILVETIEDLIFESIY